MSWKTAARRTMVGDKVVLQSSGGELWIRPKKLSQEAMDAIREEKGKSALDDTFKAALRKTMDLRKQHPGLLEGIGFDELTEGDQVEVLALTAVLKAAPKREAYRICIMHGIGEHNFAGDDGKLIGDGLSLDAASVDEVLEWGELAAEIVAAVEAYNSPLASRTAGTSQTSPSGSTTEPSTVPSQDSSPTGGTP